MKKILSIVLIIILSLALFSSCVPSSTDTGIETQGGETGGNTDKTEKGELYEQINGGDYLMGDPSKRDIFHVRHSPYKLIYTYDELVEVAENANNIESSVFEENAVLYIVQKFGSIYGKPIGFNDLKMIDGAPFITYTLYRYENEVASEAICYHEDYIVIPKSSVPDGMYQTGVIGVIQNEIALEVPQAVNVVEESALPINSAYVLKTKDEVNEFAAAYGLEKTITPGYKEIVIAICVRRPKREYYGTDSYQGYFYKRDGSTLKISYLYEENENSEWETYIEFIEPPNTLSDVIEEATVEVKERQNPVPNVGTHSS